MSAGRIKRLMDAALGKEPADLAVVNAKLLNVFTGELLSDHGICVKDGKTVFVGREAGDLADKSTHIIDADGMTAIPGFIDGHTHIAGEHLPEEFLKYAMTGGTTAVITEIFEVYFAAGLSGVLEYLEAVRGQPIKIYAAAPAMVSISELAAGIDPEDLETILAQPEIICMGESYWQSVLQQPERYLPAFETIRKYGLPLEGHSAGAGEQKLAAYLNAGISSCHEPITVQETLSRLRQGLCVMIREGSVRRDLEAVAEIRRENVDLRRLALVSDGITPEALVEKGYMEALVQKAIDLGFAPAEAVRMASLNVAEHFGMGGNIGSIAPGRDADFILIPDINHIKAECVIAEGKIIAQNGKALVAPKPHTFSDSSKNTIPLPRPMQPADFEIHARSNRSKQSIRAIEMVSNLVTREKIIETPVHKGLIHAEPENELARVAAINRRQEPGKCFTGLIKGFGIKCGALASSGAWDVSGIIVVGADESDMAAAINAICETGGGIVAVKNGRVVAQLPQPVFGTISELPMERIMECGSEIKSAAESFGIKFPDPVLSLNTLTTPAIPFLRICEQGLVDLKTGATLDLFA